MSNKVDNTFGPASASLALKNALLSVLALRDVRLANF